MVVPAPTGLWTPRVPASADRARAGRHRVIARRVRPSGWRRLPGAMRPPLRGWRRRSIALGDVTSGLTRARRVAAPAALLASRGQVFVARAEAAASQLCWRIGQPLDTRA